MRRPAPNGRFRRRCRSVTSGLVALALCLFLAAAAPFPAQAAEGSGGWGWIETAGRWFNLLILFGVIFFAVRKAAAQFFAERKAGIQKQIRAATEARKAAEEKLAKIEARANNLDQELAAVQEEARQQSELERRRIIEQAESEANKIVASARREIEGLSSAVRKDLKAYAAQLSVELAEQKIRSQISGEAEEKIVEGFFSELSSGAGR